MYEEFASHGYIVIAIDHSPDNVVTVFPTRSEGIEPYDHALPENVAEESEEERAFYAIQLRNRVAQVKACIDIMLNATEKDSPLPQFTENVTRRDLINTIRNCVASEEGVGIMGHSYGGATAVMASFQDSRIKASVMLDSWLFCLDDEYRKPSKSAASPPMLFISADAWKFHKKQVAFR